MAKPGYQGLIRIIKAAGYFAKGLRAAWKYESAFRQKIVLTGALNPFAFWLGRDPVKIGMLISCLLPVVILSSSTQRLRGLLIVWVMNHTSFPVERET